MNSNGRNYPYKFFVSKYKKTIRKMRQAYCDSSVETINYFLDIVDSLYNTLPRSVNDTDIIFIADHGFQIGQRSMIGKNTLYPEATNIPLFLKIGGENSKRPVKNDYVSSIDIFPTLLQLHSKPGINEKALGIKVDGISLLTSGQIPISQYPRCQLLGIIQTDDCMVGNDSCGGDSGKGRSRVAYMGYVVIKEINGTFYRFSEWFPFNEVRKCGWPTWVGIPKQFINNLGKWPVWNTQMSSSTDFSAVALFRELYTIGKNGLTNSVNLVGDDKYLSLINQLDLLIKKNT